MWTINWILLIGAYIFITIVMLFQVQSWFGYITGTITLVGTVGLIYLWATWPKSQYNPKQDVVKRKSVRRGRYY